MSRHGQRPLFRAGGLSEPVIFVWIEARFVDRACSLLFLIILRGGLRVFVFNSCDMLMYNLGALFSGLSGVTAFRGQDQHRAN